MQLIPKISAGGIAHVLKSPEVIAVGSAAIIAPIIEPYITSFLVKIPGFNKFGSWILVGFSIIVLLLAGKMKSGAMRAIVIGVAGATFFIGIIPVINPLVKSLGVNLK